MAVYKCRKCGSVLRLRNDMTAVCDNCGTRYALPKTVSAVSQKNVSQNSRNYPQNRKKKKNSKKKNNSGSNFFVILLVCLMALVVVALVVKNIGSGDDTDGDSETRKNNGGDKITESMMVTGEETSKNDDIGSSADSSTKQPEESTTEPVTDYPIPEFKADLSAYEMYMNPTGDQRDAYLILVNVDNPLPADYEATDMIAVKSTRKDGRQTQYLREYAAKALEAMMLEADACGMLKVNSKSGYPLSVMSAYRSYDYQGKLFNNYVNSEMSSRGISREAAEKIVATYSNRAGTSEHQAGLSVDMHNHPSANQSFKNEAEAKWLAENCYKFGFILRYPEDKMEETKGIIYEPWHFRYVGRYHATRMYELDMCLEEYVVYLENNA